MKLSFALAALFGASGAHGCSRVLQNRYDMFVSGRSMDWGFSFEDVLLLNPPGQEMDGRAGDLSVTWTSKYGSVLSSIIPFFAGYGDLAEEYGTGLGPGEGCEGLDFEKDGGSDGINTEGLAVHLLYLGEEDGTVYAEPSTTDPVNISYFRWVRYVLDNFATVAEAVEGLKEVVTIRDAVCTSVPITDGAGKVLGVHMAMEDATGDSAIIEHVGGTLQVYHSRTDALVMTNEPPYDKQKEILSQYQPWGGNITLPDELPGSVDSADRMVRLEYYLQYTPEPQTYAEAIANVRSLIGTTNVPFGAPYGGGIYPTWWTAFVDLTNKVYYFDWALTPNMVWVHLENVDLDALPGTLRVFPQNTNLEGDILCDFETMDGEDPMLAECQDAKTDASAAAAVGLRGISTAATALVVLGAAACLGV